MSSPSVCWSKLNLNKWCAAIGLSPAVSCECRRHHFPPHVINVCYLSSCSIKDGDTILGIKRVTLCSLLVRFFGAEKLMSKVAACICVFFYAVLKELDFCVNQAFGGGC